MRRSLVVAVALAGCAQPEERVTVAAPAVAAPKIDPIVKGVPHSGHIEQVAVTEQGDAALTFDNVGGVRLWPALDASRTPVPVSATAPKHLSLAHAGNDLLAAIVDQAGTVRLMRLGRDGSVRGRAQLPAEIAYKQALAIDEGVLVRTEDQMIEWFTADGASRGRLVVEPGYRVQTIAVRNNRAVAIVASGKSHELRWLLMFGGQLMWGAKLALPAAVKGDMFALSPSLHRFAMVDEDSKLNVYELGLSPTKLGDPTSVFAESDLGFIDEDRVAIISTNVQWWLMPQKETPPPSGDPWAVPARKPGLMPVAASSLTNGGGIANGLAVTGYGAALAMIDKDKVQYLGYRDHGVGNLGAAGDSLWMTMSGTRVVWLDDKLAVRRHIELNDPKGRWVYGTPIGERHVVTQSPVDGKYVVELRDLDKPDEHIKVASFPHVDRIEFMPGPDLLGISVGRTVHRYKLDLATNEIKPLSVLKTKGTSPSTVRLLDPAKADGVVAITVGWDSDWDDDYTLYIHREKGKPKRVKPFRGRILDVREDGTYFVQYGSELRTMKGDKELRMIKPEVVGSFMAFDQDMSRLVYTEPSQVIVTDGAGKELWRKPVWAAQQAVFTTNGKQLAVRAQGGVMMFDAATGERTAMECGWTFELLKEPPMTNALASAPVCEDPML